MENSLKLVPIIGWSWYFSEFIFLKRDWGVDEKKISKEMQQILDFPKDLNIVVAICCEGTRFTKEKYEESVKIAKEKGLPVLKHHLLPRSKGFNLMAKHVKEKCND